MAAFVSVMGRLTAILTLVCAGLIGVMKVSGSGTPVRLAAYVDTQRSSYTLVDLDRCHRKAMVQPLAQYGLIDDLVWSPDGTFLAALIAGSTGAVRLYILSMDGYLVTPISPENTLVGLPTWSYDGRTLLYLRGLREAGVIETDVYAYEVATGETRRLYDPYESDPSQPFSQFRAEIAPDGRTMAIFGVRNLSTPASEYSTLLVTLDTGEITPIIPPEDVIPQQVVWSPPGVFPDGDRLLFSVYSQASINLQIYHPNTGAWQDVSLGSTEVYGMGWTGYGEIFVHWHDRGSRQAALLSPVGEWTTETPIPCIDASRVTALAVYIP